MSEKVTEQWTPRWWEPEIWPGSLFAFSVLLHNVPAGTITGGAMFLDGREFPVTVSERSITARASASETLDLTHGGAAQFYLDLAGVGRVLWLTGSITGGGN